ncbi:MAG: UDP-N-acetylmuramoyl-tripeptide--D-alanyl-D-alanine ligase [Bacteroides sp.]|nr:UDP-N-acetylmuramoyl-tripeptide--D-alanyl-D-alanine ligase [Bacteroides sp.]MDD4055884.1 UDP-N-acetylmuramoyl-tripeptide--D-alanyl-D-alanine ligase [Bacteroides sp.]MDD4720524.1 UDP-N-acetylmuramoyl-tripeptide--D-alanyl-D-alanine ligase [Bacteroides sp.]
MNIADLYSIFQSCSEVTTDSRNCKQNALFIALKGVSYNGNAYAEMALSKGCSYVIVDDKEFYKKENEHYIWSENSLKTLQELANYHRKHFSIPLLGITGTNGKTTTKELIAAVLSTHFSVLYTEGNLNNHIGVPLTLLRLKENHEFAIIEMGASHPGDIEELVNIAEPTCGIITNIGKAHIEGFGSIEGVKKTKEELYTYLSTQKDSLVYKNADDNVLLELSTNKEFKQFTYGASSDCDITGRIQSMTPFVRFEWKRQNENTFHSIQTQLIGSYNLPNLLAAVSLGTYFKISTEKINQAIAGYLPENNRSQLKKTQNNTLIIDAYNANPSSMQASLINFTTLPNSNKVVILGEMRELGDISRKEHTQLIDTLKKNTFDNIYLVGKTFLCLDTNISRYGTVEELIEELRNKPLQGKTILIKGSRGVQLEKVIPLL